jgi:biotin carboxyl carrier protein
MHAGTTFKIKVFDFSSTAETLVGSADRIVAPTPGRITAVLVVSGQKVERGTPLVSVESMKMEHTLVAPADVRIISVEVSTGEQVEEGTVMVVFDRDGDA